MKCRRCKSDFAPKHAEQEVCWDCDHTDGFKLCDAAGCFELFVPSKLQKIAMQKMHRNLWICPRCSGH